MYCPYILCRIYIYIYIYIYIHLEPGELFSVSICRIRSGRCVTEGLVWLLDLRAMAHAFMPSPWGMFVYKEETSRVYGGSL